MQKNPLGILLGTAVMLMPFAASAVVSLPKSVEIDRGEVESPCNENNPEWRVAQTVDGVAMQEG
jgi:hypothetical protein